ncbi:MAG: T9SS type A sorting domain-containing protein, partial [Taibaiella sp.]|nr:T9SS type A sorting domain-containing protein [Taibaiella sp.]
CVGVNWNYYTSGSGGTWSSLNTAIATVNSSGLVHGVLPGTDTLRYVTVNSCGAVTSMLAFRVGASGFCASGVAGTEQVSGKRKLLIAPNPASGRFTLRLATGAIGVAHVAITDLLGRRVAGYELRTNCDHELELHVQAGIYVVTATLNAESHVARLIVE